MLPGAMPVVSAVRVLAAAADAASDAMSVRISCSVVLR